MVQLKESEALSASNLGLCQSIIDDANLSLSTSIDEPQGVEIKASNLQYVLDLLVDKVEEGNKKLLKKSERFQESKLELQTLDHRLGNSNVWIDGLVHQIQLMTYGNGMINTPLPIENPTITPIGNPQLVLVTNSLICEFYYACKNIVVT